MIPVGKYITPKMAQKAIDGLKKSRAFKNKKIHDAPRIKVSNGAKWGTFFSMQQRDDYFSDQGAIEPAKYIRELEIIVTTIS